MNGHLRWISLLSAIAIATRLVLLVMFGGLDEQIHDSMHDQYIYLDLARSLVAGKGFVVSTDIWVADAGQQTSLFPPLYPLFVALCFRLFGASLLALRMLQILLSLIVVVSVYHVGLYAFDRRTAVIAGIVTAVYPALALYVRPIMSEALFFPLVALLVLTSCAIDRAPRSLLLYVTWGFVAGLAIVTRTEIILLVGMLLPFLAYRQFIATKRVRLAGFSSLVLTAILVLLPYAFFNYSVHGSFSPLPNARWKLWDHTWLSAMRSQPEWRARQLPEREIVPDWSHKTERERDMYLWNVAIQFINDHPDKYLSQRVTQTLKAYPVIPFEELPPPFGRRGIDLKPDGYQYGTTSLDDVVKYITPMEKVRVWFFRIVAMLMAGGIVLILRYQKDQAYVLVLVLLWNIAHSAALVGSERLRLQTDPYLILIAAFFVSDIWSRMTVRASQRLQEAPVELSVTTVHGSSDA